MSSTESFREFVNERLTSAAEEIFGVFEKTIVKFQEEIDRQRRLLDIAWKPEIKLHRIELPQQHVCTEEEEVLADQQLCVQERNSSLDQEEPEPPQIKEEQEELCSSQEGEQLGLKQETDAFMLTPTNEESDHSEDQTMYLNAGNTLREPEKQAVVKMPVISSVVSEANRDQQLLPNNSHLAESQDHKGGKDGDSGLTRHTQPERKKRRRKKESQSNNAHTGEKSLKCDIDRQRRLLDIGWKPEIKLHRIELPQQHVCTEEEEVLADQQLCVQERNSSLDQEEPEPPQIKEEQEELCSSQEGEQLGLKQETDAFMLTPTNEESDHSEDQTMYLNAGNTLREPEKQAVVKMPVISSVVSEANRDQQLLPNNSHLAESQDHKGGKDGDSGLTRHTQPERKKRRRKKESQSNNAHTGEKSFKCDTCGKVFLFKSTFKKHMIIHTGEKPFLCKTCGKTFSYQRSLKVHMTTHTGEKPFTCTTCGQGFRLLFVLKSHMRTHTGEKPFLCKTCGKTFSQQGALNRHMTSHTGVKPFTCTTCGQGFRLLFVLKSHMRTHTGEKPFLCKTCGKTFSQQGTLNRHMIIHTGEKPFLCKTCGKTFSQQSSLNMHMIIHTGVKPYTCTTCGKAFRHTGHLKIHMRRAHTGEKPYVCNICGKRFADSSNLSRHKRCHTVK